MNRFLTVLPLAAMLLAGCVPGQSQAQPPPEAEALSQLKETFSGPALDERVWSVTRKNDFQESTIDLVDGRLRLRAATIGTKDDTVKFHGVRSVSPLRLDQPLEISFELDWNNQAVCSQPRNEVEWRREGTGTPLRSVPDYEQATPATKRTG
jgi:hypothetical protein